MEERLYIILVNRVPGIRERYRKKRGQAKGVFGRGAAWLYLLCLNISYYILRNHKLERIEKYPVYEKKNLYSGGSESSLSCIKSPGMMAEELKQYDIISFDVFDTLILRPFSEPSDIFFLVGDRLDYPDFQRIRKEMERRTREEKYKKEKSYEVTLDEIYEVLSKETGIKKKETAELEFEMELAFCFANPFMKEVVEELTKADKKIVVTSDMYLNTEQMKLLLKNCGYPEFEDYFVSCDIKMSKNEGQLFEYVKEKLGKKKNLSFAHVGDNYISDVEQADKHGFEPFHYINVNAAGEPFRPYDMSVITGSFYRGIVNAHIHNGLCCYTREYEYGYIYGGIFVTGYCQFIHHYAKRNQIDKILFLSRDGDILSKGYRMMYQENSVPNEYVYWSRLAAVKMSASHYKYDYFRRFLYHKVNQNYTLQQIFAAMEVGDMLSEFCDISNTNPKTTLTEQNVEKVRQFLLDSWERVLSHYKEQLAAGKEYYGQVLERCKKAVAVDIGWAGSGAITLDYLVNQIWRLNCEITGLIAGTNTCRNAEPDTSETFLQKGKLVSYMYSQRENRDLWKLHDPGQNHNLYWEILLDAPEGSLKGFYLNEKGGCECRFKENRTDISKIKEIQRGILDFVQQYTKIQQKAGRMAEISGRDAYAPMINVERNENAEFMKALMPLMDETNVG